MSDPLTIWEFAAVFAFIFALDVALSWGGDREPTLSAAFLVMFVAILVLPVLHALEPGVERLQKLRAEWRGEQS